MGVSEDDGVLSRLWRESSNATPRPFDIKPPIERTEPLAPVDSPTDEPTVQKRLEDLDEGVKTLLSIVDNVEKSARKRKV